MKNETLMAILKNPILFINSSHGAHTCQINVECQVSQLLGSASTLPLSGTSSLPKQSTSSLNHKLWNIHLIEKIR